jgi:[acyl-carrier-protein] S-malonyltransferase
MEEAKKELENAINNTTFDKPICPIYQNATSFAVSNQIKIKENLIAQLTSPVKWAQSIQKMAVDGTTNFIELGPGKVLQGLVRKINSNVEASSLSS